MVDESAPLQNYGPFHFPSTASAVGITKNYIATCKVCQLLTGTLVLCLRAVQLRLYCNLSDGSERSSFDGQPASRGEADGDHSSDGRRSQHTHVYLLNSTVSKAASERCLSFEAVSIKASRIEDATQTRR